MPDINGGSEIIDDFAVEDPRIRFAPCYSEASGSAGQLRNRGIPHARGQWIAFVDDDDALEPCYVEHLAEHIADYPRTEVVIFRMNDPRLGILPNPESHQIAWGQVGISFTVRADVMAEHSFIREQRHNLYNEDYEMVNSFREKQRNIFISPYVDYLVRP